MELERSRIQKRDTVLYVGKSGRLQEEMTKECHKQKRGRDTLPLGLPPLPAPLCPSKLRDPITTGRVGPK